MKKLLRLLFALLLLGLGFLYLLKNPTLAISQKILPLFGVAYIETVDLPQEVDLTHCLTYFDGCNTCMVSGGVIGGCTKMYCETPSEPYCMAYERTGMDLTNCVSYFDGCNNCTVENGRPSACTLMYCETPGEPKCNEYATGTEISGKNLSSFSDSELGITFSYPTPRGSITKTSENNLSGVMYMITLLNDGNIFLAAYNNEPPLPRGSFFGDQAKDIINTTYITNFCTNKTNCNLLTNTNNIPYSKYYEEYGEMGSTQTNTRLMYYIFNPSNAFRGIVISNEKMSSVSETDLDILVNSIQFN